MADETSAATTKPAGCILVTAGDRQLAEVAAFLRAEGLHVADLARRLAAHGFPTAFVPARPAA